MKFFDHAGKMALGSRIRLLGEKFAAEAGEIYQLYETNLQPKWFPVFYMISKSHGQAASAIAEEIGHSHASVSKILNEMSAAGIIEERTDSKDRRRAIITLTDAGKKIALKIEKQYADVDRAVAGLLTEATHDLWAALGEWEYLLTKKSLVQRVAEVKKQRESSLIRIEAYRPKYEDVFRDLNSEWITRYFKLEKPDIEALKNPKKYILDRGGFIFVATMDKNPVGVCAMIPHKKGVYELAKMAVATEARGKNVGWLLGRAVIEKARQVKAERIFLESNTILTPAINLYRKLGFKKLPDRPTPYERCNIQMELELKP
jgi:DNA-binding MarR family transcriptional regulator/predicted GNAT family N-acyltransferase